MNQSYKASLTITNHHSTSLTIIHFIIFHQLQVDVSPTFPNFKSASAPRAIPCGSCAMGEGLQVHRGLAALREDDDPVPVVQALTWGTARESRLYSEGKDQLV